MAVALYRHSFDGSEIPPRSRFFFSRDKCTGRPGCYSFVPLVRLKCKCTLTWRGYIYLTRLIPPFFRIYPHSTLSLHSFVFLSSLIFTRTQRPKHLILRTYKSSCSLDLIFFFYFFTFFFTLSFYFLKVSCCTDLVFMLDERFVSLSYFCSFNVMFFFSSSLLFFGDNTLAFLRSCLVMRVSTGRFLLYLHLFFYL